MLFQEKYVNHDLCWCEVLERRWNQYYRSLVCL